MAEKHSGAETAQHAGRQARIRGRKQAVRQVLGLGVV